MLLPLKSPGRLRHQSVVNHHMKCSVLVPACNVSLVVTAVRLWCKSEGSTAGRQYVSQKHHMLTMQQITGTQTSDTIHSKIYTVIFCMKDSYQKKRKRIHITKLKIYLL